MNKFAWGFHCSVGGNKDGLGAFISRLNAAGLPVMIKATADAGPCYEAQESGKKHGLDNLLVYRVTNNDTYEYDTPRYDLPPSEAAYQHWQATVNVWPPELDPSIVWMEPINEPRAKLEPDEAVPTWDGMHPVAWLGRFMVEYATIANAAGFKVCGPSFSSGDPEWDLWQLDGMSDWLRYCAANPTKAAVSVHEYNYGSVPFAENYPWHYGRFQAVIAAADVLGIPRTFPIFVTEFGWQYEDVPSWETAVPTLAEYNALAAKFPQVRGLALWTLQMGWGGISDQLAQWISDNGDPLTSWILANQLTPTTEPQATAAEFGATLPQTEPPDGGNGGEPVTTIKTFRSGSVGNVGALDDNGRIITLALQRWTPAGFVEDGERIKVTIPDGVAVDNVGIRIDGSQTIETENPNPPDPPDPGLIVDDIVNDLTTHPTLNYAIRPLTAITTLTIHHTVSPPDRSIESIAAYHVNSNGWPGIGYHFVIKDDGRIFQTNYLATKSYHAGTTNAPGDENLVSVGIALQGDFTNSPPPQAQQDAARDLVAWLRDLLPTVTGVLGHRQMPGAQTQCPGNTFAAWLPYVAGENKPPEPPPTGATYSTAFMRGEPGIWRVIRRADGSGEDVWELPLDSGNDVRVKNTTEGEWYEYRADGVYRLQDTSPAPQSDGTPRLYQLSINGAPGGKIAPAQAEIGKLYSYTNEVQFKAKSDCRELAENSGLGVSTFKLVSVVDDYTFKSTGFRVARLYITEQTGETQLYAELNCRVLGWVGGGASQENNVWSGELAEVYTARQIPTQEPPRYC